VIVWKKTLEKTTPESAFKALDSLRDAYDFIPTHHQFTETVRGIAKARFDSDRARAAISGGRLTTPEQAKENIAKIREMLRTIGNYGKEVAR